MLGNVSVLVFALSVYSGHETMEWSMFGVVKLNGVYIASSGVIRKQYIVVNVFTGTFILYPE